MRRTREMTRFGKQVKLRLMELNMGEGDLARALGTSPVQISRILHGERPGRKQTPRIASILGIEFEEAEEDA